MKTRINVAGRGRVRSARGIGVETVIGLGSGLLFIAHVLARHFGLY